jgi:glycosyltransferase
VADPRVSVVTVAFNSRASIEDTIRSVLTQSYPSIEYVIVDGGSTDGTLDVIKAHEHRLASWISEPDRGVADAFNKGVMMTNGDYVLFLNSDDWLADSEAVSRIMRAAVDSDIPDLIFGDCNVVDRDTGRVLRRLNSGWSPIAFRFGRTINHPALFTRRSYFQKYGVFDVSYRIAMDFELLLRGALASRIVHVPALITNMRSGGLSMRHREVVVEEIVRALKKNGLIKTAWGDWLVRGYYGTRRMLRPLRQWANILIPPS